jgi:hypothetical protein
MSTMGSDWMWTLALPGGTLQPATVERLLALAETFELSPRRPDGQINGFDSSPGHEGEHRVLDRRELVHGLATGSWSTNLWNQSEVDVFLSTRSGGIGGSDFMYLSLDSIHCRRVPDPRAQPFRELHRLLTDLWLALAGEVGASFGRVEDEWSWEQIWTDLNDPLSKAPPPPGSWPEWLSWSTYFDADRYRQLPPLSTELDADIRRTPDGAAVIVLLTDPAAVDELRFAQLHQNYRRATGLALDQAADS